MKRNDMRYKVVCVAVIVKFLGPSFHISKNLEKQGEGEREREREMLFWPIWADSGFGQARDAQNGDKMTELGAKMGPRWRQDVQDGVCLAILRPIGESS